VLREIIFSLSGLRFREPEEMTDRQNRSALRNTFWAGSQRSYGESVSPRFSINNTLLRDLCASNESSFQDEWAVKILLLFLRPLTEKNGVTWVDPTLQI
jgi:hypothetical protein